MKYNKGLAPVLILIIVLGVLVVGGGAYFVGKSSAPKNDVSDNSNYFPPVGQNYNPPTTNNNPPAQNPPPANNSQNIQSSTPVSGMPSISADKKSIVADGKILLSIDNERIISGFRSNNPWLCEMDQDWTKEMRLLCSDRILFKEKSAFTSINVSANKAIAFDLEVNRLIPNTYGNEFISEVGIFSISTNKVNLLERSGSNTKFISFSPSGKNFAYRTSCFEGFSSLCDIIIKDSETFTTKAALSYNEGTSSNEFVRWVSDNQVEYKLNGELKRKSF